MPVRLPAHVHVDGGYRVVDSHYAYRTVPGTSTGVLIIVHRWSGLPPARSGEVERHAVTASTSRALHERMSHTHASEHAAVEAMARYKRANAADVVPVARAVAILEQMGGGPLTRWCTCGNRVELAAPWCSTGMLR